MRLTLDPRSPVPLYHQIAEGIRYLLATGRLFPGDGLPTVRQAAGLWGVNLHTVRRAYADLAADGLIEVRRALGARVVGPSPSSTASAARSPAQRFALDVARRASRDFGLTAAQLAELIRRADACQPSALPAPHLTFVECNPGQAQDYARQIETRWSVSATPWLIDQPQPPPEGPIVATYFHYADVRARWPERVPDMHFVPVRINPAPLERLSAGRHKAVRRTAVLCEVDAARAKCILGDLLVILHSERVRVVQQLLEHPGDAFAGRNARYSLLFAPRLWSQLTERQKANPRAIQLEYEIEPAALESLGSALGLDARPSGQVRALSMNSTRPRPSRGRWRTANASA